MENKKTNSVLTQDTETKNSSINNSHIDQEALKKMSISEDFEPLKWYQVILNGLLNGTIKVGKFLLSILIDIGRALLNILIGIVKIVVGIFVGIYKFLTVKIYRYFKEDDIYGKISYVIMGTSSLAHRQYLNGVLYIAFEVLYIVYMILTGGYDIYRMSGPGLVGPHVVKDPITGIQQIVPGDNSILCLILGIIAILFTLVFIYVWYRNINAAHSNTIVRYGNLYSKGYKEVSNLFERDNLDYLANQVRVNKNGKVKRLFCINNDKYFRNNLNLTKQASSLISYKNFNNLYYEVPLIYREFFKKHEQQKVNLLNEDVFESLVSHIKIKFKLVVQDSSKLNSIKSTFTPEQHNAFLMLINSLKDKEFELAEKLTINDLYKEVVYKYLSDELKKVNINNDILMAYNFNFKYIYKLDKSSYKDLYDKFNVIKLEVEPLIEKFNKLLKTNNIEADFNVRDLLKDKFLNINDIKENDVILLKNSLLDQIAEYKEGILQKLSNKDILNGLDFNNLKYKVKLYFDKQSTFLKLKGLLNFDSNVGESLYDLYLNYYNFYKENCLEREKTDLFLATFEDNFKKFVVSYNNVPKSFNLETKNKVLGFFDFNRNTLKQISKREVLFEISSLYRINLNEANGILNLYLSYINNFNKLFVSQNYESKLIVDNFDKDFELFLKDKSSKNISKIKKFNKEKDGLEILKLFDFKKLKKANIVSNINNYYGVNEENKFAELKLFNKLVISIKHFTGAKHQLTKDSVKESYDAELVKLFEEFSKNEDNAELIKLLNIKNIDECFKLFNISEPKLIISNSFDFETWNANILQKYSKDVSLFIKKNIHQANINLVKLINNNHEGLNINEQYYVCYLEELNKSLTSNSKVRDDFKKDFSLEEKNYHFEYDKYNIYRTYLDFNNAYGNVAKQKVDVINCFFNLDKKNTTFNEVNEFKSEAEKLEAYNLKINEIKEKYSKIFSKKNDILSEIKNLKIELKSEIQKLKESYEKDKVDLDNDPNAIDADKYNLKLKLNKDIVSLKESYQLKINKLDGQYNSLQSDKLIASMQSEELQQAKSAYKRSLVINKKVETYDFSKPLNISYATSNIVANFTCSREVAKAVAISYKNVIDRARNIVNYTITKKNKGMSLEEIKKIVAKKMGVKKFDLGQIEDRETIPYALLEELADIYVFARLNKRVNDFKSRYQEEEYCGQCKPFKKTVNSLLTDKFSGVILFLPIVGAVIVTIFPLICSLLIGFTNYDNTTIYPQLFNWVGLENFMAMFLGKNIWQTSYGAEKIPYTIGVLLLWTLIWAFFATFTNYFLGIILSLLINKKSIKLKKVWRTIFVITIAIPQFISLMVVANIFSTQGPINSLFGTGNEIPFLKDPNLTKVMVILINCWVGVPYTMLMCSGILMNIPSDLYESSRIDGAGPVTQFFKITLPYMFFITGPSLITTFVGNINNFNVIFFLTGEVTNSVFLFDAKETDLLINWLYSLTTGDRSRYNISSALGLFIFLICAFFSLIMYSRLGAVQREDEFQ